MYCPRCGGKTPDDSRFCRSCGRPIEGQEKRTARKSPQTSKPYFERDEYMYWDDSQYDLPDEYYEDDDDGDND